MFFSDVHRKQLEQAIDLGLIILSDPNLTEDNLIFNLAKIGNVNVSDLKGNYRKDARCSALRKVGYWMFYNKFGLNYKQIADRFCIKNHSSVFKGCNLVELIGIESSGEYELPILLEEGSSFYKDSLETSSFHENSLEERVSFNTNFSLDHILEKFLFILEGLDKVNNNLLKSLFIYRSILSEDDVTEKNILGKIVEKGKEAYPDKRINLSNLKSRKRDSYLVGLRSVAFYVLRENFGLPYTWIGKLLGKEHTTIIHSIKKFKRGLSENAELLDLAFSDREISYDDLEKVVYKTFNGDKTSGQRDLRKIINIYHELLKYDNITKENFVDVIADKSEITVADLKFGGNHSKYSYPRILACYFGIKHLSISIEDMANKLAYDSFYSASRAFDNMESILKRV